MRIVAIAPVIRNTGAKIYSSKLYSYLRSEIIPSEYSLLKLISKSLHAPADVYHVQFEYRTFGNFLRSLSVLAALSVILRVRRPVVITLHGIVVPDSLQTRRFGWLYYLAFFATVKFVSLFASLFVVHSDLMKDILASRYRIHNVSMIPCGSDTGLQTRPATRTNNLVFFGFIRPTKGIEKLIEALPSVHRFLPNVSLTVAGSLARPEEISYLQELHRKVEQNKLQNNVVFKNVSFGDVDERARIVRPATAIVLPYTDSFAEISAAVHDLADYGVPIICSNTPRFSELSDGFNCLKVDAAPTDLARAILRIFQDRQLWEHISSNLRLKAQHESWPIVAEQHMAAYRNVTSGA